MRFANINLTSNHSLGEVGAKADKFEHNLGRRPLQQNELPNFNSTACQESNLYLKTCVVSTLCGDASVQNQEQHPIDDLHLCSVSSICQAPLCQQSGKLETMMPSLLLNLHVKMAPVIYMFTPNFFIQMQLHINGHLVIKNGATFVIVDKTSNPRDRSPALVIQDDGGGMGAESMRRCLSFGFSDKNSTTAIGQYGNGFKTSSMRLGADVVVLRRCLNDRQLTLSVGLLSYPFLMQTRRDRIVVPMVIDVSSLIGIVFQADVFFSSCDFFLTVKPIQVTSIKKYKLYLCCSLRLFLCSNYMHHSGD